MSSIAQIVLGIHSGAQCGRSITLEPGNSVRIGRRNIADFVLPDDAHMSSLHILVEGDVKGAVLRDLASHNGTVA